MDASIGGDRVEAERTLAELARMLATTGRRMPPRAPTLLAAGRPIGIPPSAGPAERAAAQLAVCAFVAQLRADGVPPQRMLVDVKAMAHAATSGVLDASTSQALVEDVVRWSVEAFYRA